MPLGPPAALAILLSLIAQPNQQTDGLGLRGDAQGVKFVDAGPADRLYPVNVNNWWGHMNQDGNLVVFPQFDWTDDDYDGVARAVVNGRTGYIHKSGDWFIEPIFAYADRFEDSFAVVGDGEGHYGFINRTGRLVTSMRFDGARRFADGFAAVQRGSRCGYINKALSYAVEPRFARARSFHDGLAMVQAFDERGNPGMLGYIHKGGSFVFRDRAGQFADLGDFHDGYARARVGERWGYIDKSFKLRIDAQYEAARDFANGVAAVRVGDAWGYINKAGRFLIEPKFAEADDFDDNYALVRWNDKFGYVDRIVSTGIEPQFAWGHPFSRKLARVAAAPTFGYITTTGQVVWHPAAALQGVFNLSSRGHLYARRAEGFHPIAGVPGSALIPPPPARDAPWEAPPYPPEHMYDEGLPLPSP